MTRAALYHILGSTKLEATVAENLTPGDPGAQLGVASNLIDNQKLEQPPPEMSATQHPRGRSCAMADAPHQPLMTSCKHQEQT